MRRFSACVHIALPSAWPPLLRPSLFLLVAAASAACGGSPASPSPAASTVSTVTVQSARDGLQTGETIQVTANAVRGDGTRLDVTTLAAWSTSDTSRATISATGLLTGVGPGSVTARATYQGATGSTPLEIRAARRQLRVTVTETAPTESKTIGGATLEIVGGTGAGRQFVAAADGSAVIEIEGDSARVRASRDGYITTEADLTPSAVTIRLTPALRRVTQRMRFGPTHGAQGVPLGPDQVHFVIPVHHSGDMTYRFLWDNRGGTSRTARMELRAAGKIIRSGYQYDSIPFGETLRVEAGVKYELKIFHGEGFTFLDLVVEHPS